MQWAVFKIGPRSDRRYRDGSRDNFRGRSSAGSNTAIVCGQVRSTACSAFWCFALLTDSTRFAANNSSRRAAIGVESFAWCTGTLLVGPCQLWEHGMNRGRRTVNPGDGWQNPRGFFKLDFFRIFLFFQSCKTNFSRAEEFAKDFLYDYFLRYFYVNRGSQAAILCQSILYSRN